MARTKGSKQKRNESKYWLPIGVTLSPNNPVEFHKEMHLIFIDPEWGEFISTFRGIQGANCSTHPKAVALKREKTNLERYGCSNPGANEEVGKKRRATTKERYGVEHALQAPQFLTKSRETLFSHYGVTTPMESDIIKYKLKTIFLDKYGVDNPAKVPANIEKAKKTSLARWGFDNPAKSPIIRGKIADQLQKRGFGSSEEVEIFLFLESLGFNPIVNSKFQGPDPLQQDLLIPEKNYAIEHRGSHWHSVREKGYPNDYHFRKYKAAKLNNIRLLQIFDFEWHKRNFQVKSFIKSALGKNERIVHGRKTEVREVPMPLAKQFLNDYHILGSPHTFKKAYGLYHKDELVAVATMNKHHRNNVEDVLTRFCGKYDVTVSGGLSKLCKAIENDYEEFFTFIDLRFSDGSNWLKSGWELVHQTKFDYFYLDRKNGLVIKKQAMTRRNTGRPLGMTEAEDARNRKYLTIFDAGKLKIKWSKK